MKGLIPDALVAKERYGVSLMTLWRWDRDTNLNFPKPVRIRGRKYRYAHELAEFDAAHAAARDFEIEGGVADANAA